MTPAYAASLKLKVRPTNIAAQKIDDSIFQMFGMVFASFQVKDKLRKVWFFQETFLVFYISVIVVLGMLFLILKNADI